MRYLGIDYGAKRIGLAVAAEGIAFPRGVVANDRTCMEVLADMVQKERIDTVVVGDTRSYSGRENPITKEAEDFIGTLRAKLGIPVIPTTEMGSSVEASRYAPEGEKHDDAAAAFILQRYLDMRPKAVE